MRLYLNTLSYDQFYVHTCYNITIKVSIFPYNFSMYVTNGV
jgi:hypothetical protein